MEKIQLTLKKRKILCCLFSTCLVLLYASICIMQFVWVTATFRKSVHSFGIKFGYVFYEFCNKIFCFIACVWISVSSISACIFFQLISVDLFSQIFPILKMCLCFTVVFLLKGSPEFFSPVSWPKQPYWSQVQQCPSVSSVGGSIKCQRWLVSVAFSYC